VNHILKRHLSLSLCIFRVGFVFFLCGFIIVFCANFRWRQMRFVNKMSKGFSFASKTTKMYPIKVSLCLLVQNQRAVMFAFCQSATFTYTHTHFCSISPLNLLFCCGNSLSFAIYSYFMRWHFVHISYETINAIKISKVQGKQIFD